MKNLVAIRSRNWLFTILLLIISFTFIIVWLPFLRCPLDGESYRWATGYFGFGLSSRGLSPDYLVLVIFCLLYMVLFASFYWIKNRVVFYVMLIWWWVHSFGSQLHDIFRYGDSMFHGDTLNIHVSISAIVVPLAILTLVLIAVIIVKDTKQIETNIPWSKVNRIKTWIILGPIVLQVFLLSSGEPDGLTDKLGVLIALIQCFAIPLIFIPDKSRTA